MLVKVLLRILESSQFCARIANVRQELKLLFSILIFLCGCPGVYICVPTPAVRFLNTLLWIYTVSLAVLSWPLPSHVNPPVAGSGTSKLIASFFPPEVEPSKVQLRISTLLEASISMKCADVSDIRANVIPSIRMFFVCPIRIAAFPPNSLSKTTFPLPIILMSWTPLYP